MQEIENFEKAFYQDGFDLGMNALNAGGNDSDILNALNEMYKAIDNLISSVYALAQQQKQKIDCKLGCEWCCHQPVFAMTYELDYLQKYLCEYFDEETLSLISENAQKKQDKLKGLKDDELLNAKHPCPLLGEGACMAYEARPIACRIYLSTDVNTCKRFFDKPDDKDNYPALMDMPMRLGRMMNEGFKAALAMGRVDFKEYRIEEKLV